MAEHGFDARMMTEMLDQLPLVRAAVELRSRKAGEPYLAWLLDICNRWSIFARYSSLASTMTEARSMVDRVRVLKEVI